MPSSLHRLVDVLGLQESFDRTVHILKTLVLTSTVEVALGVVVMEKVLVGV